MQENINLTTDVKKQHTVPRFLLNNFGFIENNKINKLYTFDKKNSRIFQQSVLDATTRNTFYNIKNHPDRLSLEPLLGIYESGAAPLIDKIIKENNISWLSVEDKYKIATFIAIQKARSYGELQRIEGLIDGLSEKFRSIGFSSEDFEAQLGEDQENNRKNIFLTKILDQNETVSILIKKSWILYQTNMEHPFYISDNPITLHNNNDMGFWGNLGLSLKGIQIHIPLSSTLTLALTCPSISELAIQSMKKIKLLKSVNHKLLKQLNNPDRIIELGKSYEQGIPLNKTPENVKFLNSLQVTFAEQFIFCEKDKFNLVEQMIKDNEEYRKGPRFQIG